MASYASGTWRATSFVVLMATAVASPSPARARAIPRDLGQLKAAYVLNFVRYAEWPEDAFAHDASPIVIGVAGDADFADDLEALVDQETVGGRSIEVRRIGLSALENDTPERERAALVDELRELHLLFIGSITSQRLDWLLARLEGEHVLTVSDVEHFAERGGMLGLVLRGRRLAFDANLDEIQRSRVSMSSQVLRLARVVGDGSC